MANAPRIFEFGRFALDTSERVLRRDGAPVPLTPKAVDTLIALVQKSGRIVDKSELMTTVWPDTFVGEDSLTRNVSALRKVLGDDFSEEFIETVARRGYRFTAKVSERQPENGAILVARRTTVRIVTETDVDDDQGGSGSDGTRRTIAVLPFMMLDADESEPFLGLGLADALISKLTRIRRIAVRPTSAILKYAGDDDPVRAGRELRVESVLNGTIQRRGDRIRVTTQLVGVQQESAMWAETFDERFTDIFAVEDSISEKVAAALVLEVTGEERRLLTRHHTDNPEAYRWILRGRYFWSKGAGDWFGKAFESFQQAIVADPNDAVAHIGLADCYNMMGFWGNLPATQAFPQAEASATTALSLDPTLAEAHAALAWATLHHRYDRADAEQGFLRSLALNPASISTLQWWSLFLAQEGRFDEALVAMRRAYSLDPLNLHTNYNLGVVLMVGRRDDEAIAQFQRTIELDPGYFMALSHLGFTYALKGLRAPAMAAQGEVNRLIPGAWSMTGVALLAAMFGERETALITLERVKEAAQTAFVVPSSYAQSYAYLRDNDQAIAWLERAYVERDPWLVWLKTNPCFDPIRDDPRFTDLVRRVGLTP